jgi:ABC-type dipeptide/oligopeptide/nickel transport system ATPase component
MRGREIGLILQSAMSSLNPALRIATQMREAWKAHASTGNADEVIAEALRSVGLPFDESFLRRYPAEVSVGQGQRILIAMGLLHNPSLLIADEPTSALDIITQAEVLELFRKLNREKGSAILLISHDLLSVASICHRVAILNGGRIVECAPTAEIFQNPKNEYTRRLVEAIPGGRALASGA